MLYRVAPAWSSGDKSVAFYVPLLEHPLIPHEKITPEKVGLPKRSRKEAFDDISSMANRRFVPEKY